MLKKGLWVVCGIFRKVGEGWGMSDRKCLYLCSRKLGSEGWLISESSLTCCVFFWGGDGFDRGDRFDRGGFDRGDGFDGGE